MKPSTIIANIILCVAIVAAIPTTKEAGGPHPGARREAEPKKLTGPLGGARRDAEPKKLTGPLGGARREAEPEPVGSHDSA